ncbi:hypothetical protein AGMMS49949_03660 [Alphaproteobacteria bacterium]|nr:hypothetical protein AGMMS49949_03660 [Alphaproteobacteria bacterium]GHS96399.1 hypothetical protein AGMMS50296_2490 [Alphaproteobacteria bacterium]
MFSLRIYKFQEEMIPVEGVVRLVLETECGRCEVLSGHEPFFTVLKEGDVCYWQGAGEKKKLPIAKGFFQFTKETGTLWLH